MRPNCNRSGPILVAAAAFFSFGLSDANADQQSVVTAEVGSFECSEMAFEVAYQTSPRFISWLLERPELIAQIAAAEGRAVPDMLKATTFVNGEINNGRKTGEQLGLAGGGGE